MGKDLQIDYFVKMHRNEPVHVIPTLIYQLRNEKGPSSEFVLDCLEDEELKETLALRDIEGVRPYDFFDYINNCCRKNMILGLEQFIKIYNKLVDPEYRVCGHRIKYTNDYVYDYSWFIEWEKQNSLEFQNKNHYIFWFTRTFKCDDITVSDIENFFEHKNNKNTN